MKYRLGKVGLLSGNDLFFSLCVKRQINVSPPKMFKDRQ